MIKGSTYYLIIESSPRLGRITILRLLPPITILWKTEVHHSTGPGENKPNLQVPAEIRKQTSFTVPLARHSAKTDKAISKQNPFSTQKDRSEGSECVTLDQSSSLHPERQEIFSLSSRSPSLVNVKSLIIITVIINMFLDLITTHLHSKAFSAGRGNKFHHTKNHEGWKRLLRSSFFREDIFPSMC